MRTIGMGNPRKQLDIKALCCVTVLDIFVFQFFLNLITRIERAFFHSVLDINLVLIHCDKKISQIFTQLRMLSTSALLIRIKVHDANK